VLRIFKKPANFDGTVRIIETLRRLMVEHGDISRRGSRVDSEKSLPQVHPPERWTPV
jgi:hypothetical protein